jgi:hypothetical protein
MYILLVFTVLYCISDASFSIFASFVFLSVTSACAPFLVAGLALRCHVSPSSQAKNLPAMKGTSEGGEREPERVREEEVDGAA